VEYELTALGRSGLEPIKAFLSWTFQNDSRRAVAKNKDSLVRLLATDYLIVSKMKRQRTPRQQQALALWKRGFSSYAIPFDRGDRIKIVRRESPALEGLKHLL